VEPILTTLEPAWGSIVVVV